MIFRSLVIGALTLAATQAATAQEIVLKIAHFLPPNATTQKQVLEPWCETLKAESNGRIGCQFYPAMQLGGAPAQLVEQVKSGVADIVWTAAGYSMDRFPRIEAFELPFVVRDATSGSKAVWQFYEKYNREEFSAFHPLAFHVDGGQALHTKSKRVVAIEDWKGLKLRASSGLGAKLVTALGATPVAMPPPQFTDALSKGAIDGGMGSWELARTLRLEEATAFHAQPPEGGAYPYATVLMILMNKQRYESLPADLKAFVDRTTGLALSEQIGRAFDQEKVAAQKAVRARGGEISEFSIDMTSAMRAVGAAVEADWLKAAEAKGLDGKAVAAAARELAK